MRFLRQSTASQEILLGPFVATADGSAQTGLTIANTDIKLLKGGATSETNKNSGGGTHIAGGRYSAVLDATDTNTVGILEVSVNPASGIPWNKSYYVLEEAVYDMLFAASALGYIANAPVNVAQFGGTNGTFDGGRPEVNATHWGGTAVASARPLVDVAQISGDSTAADNLESYCDGTTPQPVNVTQLSGDATAADNAEAFFDGTGYAGTNNVIPTVTNVTNLHASAATAAELAKVPKSDGTATWNATALASINAQADLALADYDGPTNAEMVARTLAAADYATATALGTVDTVVDGIKAVTDALPDAGALTSIAQASALATVDGNVDAIKATTDKLDDTLEDQGGGTYGFTEAALQEAPTGGGSGPSAADIADAVWEEALGDHSSTSGSTAEALAAAGGAGDPWITPLPGSYTSGQAGYILGTNLNATVSSRASQTSLDTVDGIVDDILADTADMQPKLGTPAGASMSADIAAVKAQTAAIEADTQDLQAQVGTDGAGLTAIPWNAAWDAEVQSECADALTAYDGPTRAEATADKEEIVADIAALNDLSAAEVNAEVDAALADYDPPTRAELTSDTNSVLSAVGDVPTAEENADAVLDEAVEGSVTLRQSIRLHNAALGGKASGLETTEAKYRDLADTKDRITATVDSDGNRTAVSRDLS